MKRILIIFCFLPLLILVACAPKGNRTILNPDYPPKDEYSQLEVTRVDLTDTATVVHLRIISSYQPWGLAKVWLRSEGKQYAFRCGRRISTDGDGIIYTEDRKLPVQTQNGTEEWLVPMEEPFVDGKIYMRTSQVDSLVLCFEPLPETATSFDFSNDIQDISLIKSAVVENKASVIPMPDVTPDKLFESIVERFPGKVVFIDLWATWCGPCVHLINAMGPVKEELKDEDVVFVYLTNTTSPEELWKKKISGMKGYHLRMDKEYWDRLPCIEEHSGIPQSFIYDRNGICVYRSMGFGEHVAQDYKNEIRKALKD